DDELGADRRLLELSGAPPIGLGEAPLRSVLEQRQDLGGDVVMRPRCDRARADVVEPAVVAVEAEQQRRDLLLALALPAQADANAVGRLLLLDLHDALARAREVRQPELLRHDPVQTHRLEPVEPSTCSRDVARPWRDPKALERLDAFAALLQRLLPDRLAVPEQDVEDDQFGGNLAREAAASLP